MEGVGSGWGWGVDKPVCLNPGCCQCHLAPPVKLDAKGYREQKGSLAGHTDLVSPHSAEVRSTPLT